MALLLTFVDSSNASGPQTLVTLRAAGIRCGMRGGIAAEMIVSTISESPVTSQGFRTWHRSTGATPILISKAYFKRVEACHVDTPHTPCTGLGMGDNPDAATAVSTDDRTLSSYQKVPAHNQ